MAGRPTATATWSWIAADGTGCHEDCLDAICGATFDELAGDDGGRGHSACAWLTGANVARHGWAIKGVERPRSPRRVVPTPVARPARRAASRSSPPTPDARPRPAPTVTPPSPPRCSPTLRTPRALARCARSALRRLHGRTPLGARITLLTSARVARARLPLRRPRMPARRWPHTAALTRVRASSARLRRRHALLTVTGRARQRSDRRSARQVTFGFHLLQGQPGQPVVAGGLRRRSADRAPDGCPTAARPRRRGGPMATPPRSARGSDPMATSAAPRDRARSRSSRVSGELPRRRGTERLALGGAGASPSHGGGGAAGRRRAAPAPSPAPSRGRADPGSGGGTRSRRRAPRAAPGRAAPAARARPPPSARASTERR